MATSVAVDDGGSGVTIYHCLCTQVVAGTIIPLEQMPKRQTNGTAIAILGNFGGTSQATMSIQGLLSDSKAMVLKLDDGFEKRYPVRCSRCALMTGYHLDKSQSTRNETDTGPNEDVLYVLPGGLVTTEELRAGKDMEKQVGMVMVG